MVLMFILLLMLGDVPDDLSRLATSLLRHLYLYFIPAAVGVTAHIALVVNQLVPILTAVVVSSALAMIVSGLLMQSLTKTGRDDAV
jgi:holin-like protein